MRPDLATSSMSTKVTSNFCSSEISLSISTRPGEEVEVEEEGLEDREREERRSTSSPWSRSRCPLFSCSWWRITADLSPLEVLMEPGNLLRVGAACLQTCLLHMWQTLEWGPFNHVNLEITHITFFNSLSLFFAITLINHLSKHIIVNVLESVLIFHRGVSQSLQVMFEYFAGHSLCLIWKGVHLNHLVCCLPFCQFLWFASAHLVWNNIMRPLYFTRIPQCVSLQWCILWWSFSHAANLKEKMEVKPYNIVKFSGYLPRGWDHRWVEATVLTYRAPELIRCSNFSRMFLLCQKLFKQICEAQTCSKPTGFPWMPSS